MLDAGPSGRKDAADKARDQGHRDRYRDLRLAAPPTPQPREVRLRFLNVPGVAGGDAHGGEPPLHRLIDGTLRGLFGDGRSEEHTYELQSLMRISYAVFCLQKTNYNNQKT